MTGTATAQRRCCPFRRSSLYEDAFRTPLSSNVLGGSSKGAPAATRRLGTYTSLLIGGGESLQRLLDPSLDPHTKWEGDRPHQSKPTRNSVTETKNRIGLAELHRGAIAAF